MNTNTTNQPPAAAMRAAQQLRIPDALSLREEAIIIARETHCEELATALNLLLNQAEACPEFIKTFLPSSREKARAALERYEKGGLE